MAKKITKILIANRGEIARRIQRAATGLGLQSLCIASEADKDSLFAREAEQLEIIGPAPAAESYLAIDKIIATAKQHNCDAIHPGYGFLSENAHFAEAAQEAGIIFIGPDPEHIRSLGSKTEARKLLEPHGVPCTPGCKGGLSDAQIIKEAKRIGFPLMLKAVAGGGGRGMRIVRSETELTEGLPRARAEAKKFFSDEDVYLEKYVENPRHIEVQLLGDQHGKVLHFGTRDCSVQRRHQKLVEEAPAAGLSKKLENEILEAAVKIGQVLGYHNAGTVEFLVSGKDFYFLEMNTRIQVEHPATEAVTGHDLVRLQIEVARGEKLAIDQKDISFSGHAIEYRLYAEDPFNNFMPTKGTFSKLEVPPAEYLREDGAYEAGDSVNLFYDAMLSKVIVQGKSRAEAIARSRSVFSEYQIEGVQTTIPFHVWLLHQPAFCHELPTTSLIDQYFTPENLAASQKLFNKDPSHQGNNLVEQHYFYPAGSDEEILVEVVHRNDGLFLARPKKADSNFMAKDYWRLSPMKQWALDAVKMQLESESSI